MFSSIKTHMYAVWMVTALTIGNMSLTVDHLDEKWLQLKKKDR